MLTKRERAAVVAEVRRMFRSRDPRSIRIQPNNGAVTVLVDSAHGFQGPVRILAGWVGDLLDAAEPAPTRAQLRRLAARGRTGDWAQR